MVTSDFLHIPSSYICLSLWFHIYICRSYHSWNWYLLAWSVNLPPDYSYYQMGCILLNGSYVDIEYIVRLVYFGFKLLVSPLIYAFRLFKFPWYWPSFLYLFPLFFSDSLLFFNLAFLSCTIFWWWFPNCQYPYWCISTVMNSNWKYQLI